jgi:uncharacterized membrane protein YfcA
MWEFILPIIGFLVGILASLVGVGGGIIIVPLLTLAFSFSPSNAVGTSLAVILFTAAAAALNFSRQKRIYYKTGLILASMTAPGAFLGAYLTSIIPSDLLGLFFGVFLIIISFYIIIETTGLRKKETKHEAKFGKNFEKDLFANKRKLVFGVALGFFGGLASGLLGIGGGIILVPIMTIVLGMTIHFAVATSMVVMFVTSLSGVGQHYFLGNINFEYALLLGIGSIAGAQVGAHSSKKISGKNLRIIFSIFLLSVSVQMLLKFL